MSKHLVKTLIAAAAMSACFAAHAADVTVYGNLDASYTNYEDSTGTKVQALTSGVKDASFIGFRGAEDLGRGLKAEFALESAFDLTNGNQKSAGTLFSRNSYVGLSGALGTVKLGQISSFSRDLVKKYDAFSDGMWSASSGQFNTSGDFQSKSIAYSNTIGPVKTGVSYKVAGIPGGGLSEGSATSIAVNYEQGPLSVGGVYSMNKADPTKTAKTTQLGASYELRFAKAFALYEEGKDTLTGFDAKTAYLVGMKAPIASGTSVLLSGGHKESENGIKHDLISVGTEYSLSKRTALYASYLKDDVKDIGYAKAFTAGVSHSF